MLFVMRLAREQGITDGIEFVCKQLHYSMPQPIQPVDEAADLQRRFIAATADLAKMFQQIQGLSK